MSRPRKQRPNGTRLYFHRTGLPGAWLIEPSPAYDGRGYFMRTYCSREFQEHGLAANFVQHSVSYSVLKGTLRGMHFQRPPHEEVKVVACLKGAIWDVIVDLRPASPTFMRWECFPLTAENRHQLYIPEGIAHGFQTLLPHTEVGYMMSTFYAPEAADGVRYDDPAFSISWPLQPVALSERDKTWPPFRGPEEGLSPEIQPADAAADDRTEGD